MASNISHILSPPYDASPGVPMADSTEIEELQLTLQKFAEERDWEQFHSPKNLAMALSAEAGELLEHFQWLTEADSYSLDERKLQDVREEIADVFIYLLRLADRLDIDPLAAAKDKIALNETKYPADRVRGSSAKYSEYKND